MTNAELLLRAGMQSLGLDPDESFGPDSPFRIDLEFLGDRATTRVDERYQAEAVILACKREVRDHFVRGLITEDGGQHGTA